MNLRVVLLLLYCASIFLTALLLTLAVFAIEKKKA